MCEQLEHKICLAQDTADRTGLPQAITRNEIGGYNIIPSSKACEGAPLIVLGRREDPEQLTDEQCLELFAMSDKVGKEHAIRATYSLGIHTAKRAAQRKIDNLMTERSELLNTINELKLMLSDAESALND